MRTCDPLVDRFASEAQALLGSDLLCFAEIGSLAHGGFSETISDVDLAMIVSTSDRDREIAALWARAKEWPLPLAPKLSVFWGDKNFGGGRFPAIDRLDLLEHGSVSFGTLPKLPAPSRKDIRDQLLSSSIPYWMEKTQRFIKRNPDGASEIKELSRCLLYPARLIFSWTSGGVTSNDDAFSTLQKNPPEGLLLEPIEAALAHRRDEVDDAALLSHTGSLAKQFEATLSALKLEFPADWSC